MKPPSAAAKYPAETTAELRRSWPLTNNLFSYSEVPNNRGESK